MQPAALLAAVTLAFAPLAHGDPCNPTLIEGPDSATPGVSENVYAITWWDVDGDGPEPPLLIVSGEFRSAGDTDAHTYAAWDGARWRPLGTGDAHVSRLRANEFAGFQGRLYAGCVGNGTVQSWGPDDGWRSHLEMPFAIYGLTEHDGMLVAGTARAPFVNDDGTEFTSAIGAWDGSRWTPVGDTPLDARRVTALASFQGDLYAGIQRTATESTPAFEGLARLHNGEWSIDPTIIGRVEALTVSEGRLYVGGAITSLPGYETAGVAAWDGMEWDPLGGGLDQPVEGLAPYPGGVVAVGEFTESVEGVPVAHVAAWHGGAWHPLSSGIGARTFAPLCGVVASRADTVVVGGKFTTAGGVGVANIALWSDGAWSSLGPGMSDQVAAFFRFRDRLYLGGGFRFGPDGDSSGLAAWDGDRVVRAGPALDGDVLALATFEGHLVAGGTFLRAGGASMRRIAAFDGQRWHPFGTGLIGTCRALVAVDGTLFAAGDVTRAGSANVRHIAQWDGGLWSDVGGGVNGAIHALVQHDGAVVAAGEFTEAGGVPANRIARWDGARWRPMGDGFEHTVFALTVHEGSLYAGGFLGASGATPMSHVARWNGQDWISEGAGLPGSPDPYGNLPAVRAFGQWQGRLVVGGSSRFIPSQSAFVSIRDGDRWSRVTLLRTALAFEGLDAQVNAIDGHGSEIVFGGVFGQESDGLVPFGKTITNLGRWSASGAPWIAHQPVIAADGPRATISIVPASGYDACGPLHFQWRRNNTPLIDGAGGASAGGGVVSGAAAPTLVIDDIRPSDAGAYTVTVTNACGSAVSIIATLDIVDPLCPADMDASGVIDAADFVVLAAHFGTPAGALRTQGDCNGDGRIDAADVVVMASQFGLVCP